LSLPPLSKRRLGAWRVLARVTFKSSQRSTWHEPYCLEGASYFAED
ncbi:hypothetical protein CEXT_330171, partial [Caerostris extrusa]